MKKLVIKNIENYIYILNDGKETYRFNFEFYDVKPNIDDILYVHDSLLRKTHELLSFGPINGIYGKEIIDDNDPDILVLKQNNNLIYLKRYYG